MRKPNVYFKATTLIVVLLFPTLLYLVLTTGKHNFETLEVLYPIGTSENTHKDYHKIPEFELINQEGKRISNTRVRDKVWIANYFFTTCQSICPIMNNNLLGVQKELSRFDAFHMLSFTVNPEHDTSEVLQAYAEGLGANTTNWDFLTGEKKTIYTLANQGMFLGAADDAMEDGGVLHSESVVIIDKEGRIRSRKDKKGNVKAAYNATSDIEIKELIEDLKCLLAEYQMELKKNKKEPL